MARERKDRSSNWFIEHCGGALLRLTHLDNIVSWQAAHNVLSHPKQVPDGLLDVTFADRPVPDPFLIEIESYPDPGTYEQIRRDLAMVLLSRGVVPDMMVLVLRPKGNLRIDPDHVARSAHGLTELGVKVHVVNLWTIPAADLLDAGDVRLIPMVPLSQFDGAPRELFEECRERIDSEARADEHDNLLAVARTLAEARYDDVELLSIFGVNEMSIAKIFFELPTGKRLLKEAAREMTKEAIEKVEKAEAALEKAEKAAAEAEKAADEATANAVDEAMRKLARKATLRLLRNRFGSIPKTLIAKINAIEDQDQLDALLTLAGTCADLKAFRSRLD